MNPKPKPATHLLEGEHEELCNEAGQQGQQPHAQWGFRVENQPYTLKLNPRGRALERQHEQLGEEAGQQRQQPQAQQQQEPHLGALHRPHARRHQARHHAVHLHRRQGVLGAGDLDTLGFRYNLNLTPHGGRVRRRGFADVRLTKPWLA